MKKYFYLFCMAVAALAFTACEGGDKPSKDKGTTFQITVSNVTATEATVAVVPSKADVPYFANVFSKADLTEYFNGNLDSCLNYFFTYYGQQYDDYAAKMDLTQYDIYNLMDFLKYVGILNTGNFENTFEDLNCESEYIAFAVAYDSITNATKGTIAQQSFTTGKLEKVTLNVTITAQDGKIVFTPSDEKTSYVIAIEECANITSYGHTSTSYWAAWLDAYAGNYDEFQYSGAVALDASKLTEGSTYIMYMQAYAGGQFNSDLVIKYFNTNGETTAPEGFKVAARNIRPFDVEKKEIRFEAPALNRL